MWRYYKYGEPIVRPIFLDFDEKEHFDKEDIFCINENIILVPILEKNCKNKEIFLPFSKEGWYDFYSMEYIASGGKVIIETPINKAIIIVRGATIVPLSDTNKIKKTHLTSINKILIFPSKTKISKTQKNLPMIFDDGWSRKNDKNNSLILTPVISINKNNIELDFLKNGFRKIKQKSITIITDKNYSVSVKKYSKIFKNNF